MSKINIFNEDCLSFLKGLKSEDHYDTIFADPLDNIGLKYHDFKDVHYDYYGYLMDVVVEAMKHTKVFWLSYYWRHDLEIKFLLKKYLKEKFAYWDVKTFIWRFKFGQYRETDCGSGFRFLLRISKLNWQPNVERIRVPSERMRLGDKRAAGLKVPDDVWGFPRIQGNNKERRDWHPTQHPEALMERIYLMSVKGKEGRILDLYGGSGTSIVVCEKLGFDLDIIEIDPFYCSKMKELL